MDVQTVHPRKLAAVRREVAPDAVGSAFGAIKAHFCRVSFCTRQFISSATYKVLGSRQSISLTMPNSLICLPALPKRPTHRAVQLHLVDLAVEEGVLGRVGVGAVEKLLRAGRDADGPGRAHVRELGLERAVVVEHLNALIAHIGDVDVAAGIDGDGVRNIELAGFGTGRAPGLDELPVLVELGDAGVAVTVGDENVAGSVPGHVEGLVEVVAGDTRSRGAGSAAEHAAAAELTDRLEPAAQGQEDVAGLVELDDHSGGAVHDPELSWGSTLTPCANRKA